MDSITNNLPLDALQELDRLADDFEADFSQGNAPSALEFATRLSGFQNQAIIELIRIEAEIRRRASQSAGLADFLKRYPNHLEQVTTALSMDALQSDHSNDQETVDCSNTQSEFPLTFGRFEVVRLLGEGGFGSVYLAKDTQLGRLVAAKTPRLETSVHAPDQIQQFLTEARIAAGLKHPQLVSVYDVLVEDGQICIVQEYVEGLNLRNWVRENGLCDRDLIELFLKICEPLEYLHTQGFTHCDLKFANVLIDRGGDPHVADFGLTLRAHVRPTRRDNHFGTPVMMAPEQVRGEIHRIDCRTDVWAIGAMLFELAFGTRPFVAKTQQHLFEKILSHEPATIDSIEDDRRKAIHAICSRCLSKRMQDRFPSVAALRDELEAWDKWHRKDEDRISCRSPKRLPTPRGLRPFTAEDADFFVDLLPGPKTIGGIPESLNFWRTRIENAASCKSFPVGLVYGPSGSGKSSMIKAGLIPLLKDAAVQCIVVEGSVLDTETRIQTKFESLLSQQDADAGLADTFASVREQSRATGESTLLVIDQFEQWLSSDWMLGTNELVDALRQCDGQHLQTLLLVRDEFYLSVNRLFLELEVSLDERVNQAVVDLIPVGYANVIVLQFGQGTDRIENPPTSDDKAFIASLVDLVAHDGRVVCVHLAILLEMMKDKQWELSSLDRLGSFTRIGEAYLAKTFDSPSAQPVHRANARLVRSILGKLLPMPGAEIRGTAKSTEALSDFVPSGATSKDVERVIQLLDSDLHLITPVDAEVDDHKTATPQRQRRYQLAHDYLVPSIRDWLTQSQRMTRRGRAELDLQESSGYWQQRRDSRLLPGIGGWLRMRLLTDPSKWNPNEREFMRSTRRSAARKSATIVTLMSLVLLMTLTAIHRFSENSRRTRLAMAIDNLTSSDDAHIPDFVSGLTGSDFSVDEAAQSLASRWENADQRERFRLACALAELEDTRIEFLVSHIPNVADLEAESLFSALSNSPNDSTELLNSSAVKIDDARVKARMAITALRLGDSTLAAAMTSLKNTIPESRTLFIDECSKWRGDVAELLKMAPKLKATSLQSALCLAAGKTPLDQLDLSPQALEEIRRAAVKLYLSSRDSGVHSASGWLLRSFNLETPSLTRTSKPATRASWYENPEGIAMIRVKAGDFDWYPKRNPEVQSVRLTRDFWLADREISIALFQVFVNDRECPIRWRVELGDGPAMKNESNSEFPVQMVNWDDAVKFCNWLSRKNKLEPCYELQGEFWELTNDTGGYRLPTEAEWEYACRAGTVTPFFCGAFGDFITDYAVVRTSGFRTNYPKRCGSKMPNGWGFFDLHGNVWEWCNDWYEIPKNTDPVSDPVGPKTGNKKVHRGGDSIGPVTNCESSKRDGYPFELRESNLGFRIARTAMQ